MRRQHFHYKEWEDYQAGMYQPSDDIPTHAGLSADLLRDQDALREAMRDVTQQWPVSTAQNLTDTGSNRRSWLGQAACCLAHGSPEFTTCQAWWTLTDAERDAANAVADEVIAMWEMGVDRAQTSFGI